MSLPGPVQAAVDAGFSVVPATMDKRPRVEWKAWQTRVQTASEVEALGHGSVWGLVTGALYGVTVLDFDEAHGGMETLAALDLNPHVRTPGGVHVYVRHPGYPVRNSVRKFEQYPGMDIRGDGGLAWFAGRSKKGTYTPLVWPPFPVILDDDLTEELFPHPQAETERAPKSEYTGAGRGVPEAVRYLDRLAEDIITAEPGTSNAVLNKAAFAVGGLIAAGQLDPGYGYAVLLDAAHDRKAGDPETVIEAALTTGAEKPWKFEPDESDWIPAISLKVFRQSGIPDPVPFPIDAFPAPLDELIRQGSTSVSAPPDYIGAGLLPALGVAIGGYVDLEITETWKESALVYTALVGVPGARKTPAMKIVMRPIWDAEKMLYDVAREEAEESLSWNEVDPPQIVVDDSTIEALFGSMEKNPRGLLMRADELTGWVQGMGQYKGGLGRDRQHWLSIWSRDSIKVGRKTTRSHWIPKPFVAVLGGIQPDPLEDLLHGRDDGLLPRILMARGEFVTPQLRRGVMDTGLLDRYGEVWSRLRDQGSVGQTVQFTEAGYHAFETYVNEHYKTLSKVPPELAGAWSKMDGQLGRISLIMARLLDTEATAEVVDRAVELVRYFQGQAAGLLQGSATGTRWEKTNAARMKALARFINDHPGAGRAELMAMGPEWALDGRTMDGLLRSLGEMGVWNG